MKNFDIKSDSLASILLGKNKVYKHRFQRNLLLSISYDEWLKFVEQYSSILSNRIRFNHRDKIESKCHNECYPNVILLDYSNILQWDNIEKIRAYFYEMSLIIYDEINLANWKYYNTNKRVNSTPTREWLTSYSAKFDDSSNVIKSYDLITFLLQSLTENNVFNNYGFNENIFGMNYDGAFQYNNIGECVDKKYNSYENEFHYLMRVQFLYLQTSLDILANHKMIQENRYTYSKSFINCNYENYKNSISDEYFRNECKNFMPDLELLKSRVYGLHILSDSHLENILNAHSNIKKHKYEDCYNKNANNYNTLCQVSINGYLEILCLLYYAIGTNLISFSKLDDYKINIDWSEYSGKFEHS